LSLGVQALRLQVAPKSGAFGALIFDFSEKGGPKPCSGPLALDLWFSKRDDDLSPSIKFVSWLLHALHLSDQAVPDPELLVETRPRPCASKRVGISGHTTLEPCRPSARV
jgi:hypothetical protein